MRSNHTLRFLEEDGLIQTDPATLAEELEADAWSPLSAGEGAKGPRLYERAKLPLGFTKNDDFERWVLFRKSLRDPKALANYFVHAPKGRSLAEIAGAAGLRWTTEEGFLRANDDLGLDHCEWCDHCEVRSWHGWHRHMTLVMAASAFLAKLAADQRRDAFSKAKNVVLNAEAA